MMVSQAISKGDIQAVNYFVAQKYVQALGDIAASNNTKLVMMPLESSQVIGSIAGIGDIVKEVQNKMKG
jgi:regulator of protease activity HflC (stomatin/prohibitin superfamily)